MIIGVDLDGVCYPFREEFHRRAGRPLTNDPNREFWKAWGWDKATYRHWEQTWRVDGLYRTAAPYEGTRAGLRALRKAGHSVVIVTSRPILEARADTVHWLAEHRIPHDALTFAAEKSIARTDMLVDDTPAVLGIFTSTLAYREGAVCWDQPYNRDWPGQRASSWAEVLDYGRCGQTVTSDIRCTLPADHVPRTHSFRSPGDKR